MDDDFRWLKDCIALSKSTQFLCLLLCVHESHDESAAT